MTIDRAIHKIDAEGKRVGRLATEVATLLRGKHKPTFAPHTDCGDIVEIYNTAKVRLSGKKWSDKIYYRHSGHPGGIRERSAEEAHADDPTFLVRNAVRGMLPDNKLRSNMMKRLKLFAISQDEINETAKNVTTTETDVKEHREERPSTREEPIDKQETIEQDSIS